MNTNITTQTKPTTEPYQQLQNVQTTIFTSPAQINYDNISQQLEISISLSKSKNLSLQQETVVGFYTKKHLQNVKQSQLQTFNQLLYQDKQRASERIRKGSQSQQESLHFGISSIQQNIEKTQAISLLQELVFSKDQILPNFRRQINEQRQKQLYKTGIKISEGQEKWLKKAKRQIYRNKKYKNEDIFSKFRYEQLFTYYETKIKIATGQFANIPYKKYALFIPFTTLQLQDDLANFVAQKLSYNIYEQLRCKNHHIVEQHMDEGIYDGKIICKNSFGFNRFIGIYWAKAPTYKFQKQYCTYMLKITVSNLFSSMLYFKQKYLLISSFSWPCLSDLQASRILITELMNQIKKNKYYQKYHIREITILFNKTENYLVYAQTLRKISDEYAKLGLGFN